MSNDLVPQDNPFNKLATQHGGSVAIESERAIAEAQGQLILAKRFPRDLNAAYAELMDACKMQALASVAFYSVPRSGGSVSGPSIRLAEEIARVFGNFEFGHRELSRTHDKSEVEVYAWDKQTNNRSIRQITVMHVLDTKNGARPLRDQKDIDDKIANVASKQLRGRILAMMPKWMVEAAIQECRKTLAGDNSEPLSVRVRKMTQAFAAYGVKTQHIENYLGIRSLDDIVTDQLLDLTGVFNALREGGKPSDYFTADDDSDKPSSAAAAITAAATAQLAAPAEKPAVKRTAPARRAAEPAPQPEAEPATDTAKSQPEPVRSDEKNSTIAQKVSNNPKDESGEAMPQEEPAAATNTAAAAQPADDDEDVF